MLPPDFGDNFDSSPSSARRQPGPRLLVAAILPPAKLAAPYRYRRAHALARQMVMPSRRRAHHEAARLRRPAAAQMA